ncbi:MAG: OsmC family protein [Symbiobacteriia bacterium]
MSKSVAVKWVQGMEFQAQTGSGHSIIMDAREEVGGQNHGARPAEMVLVGLGGCTGMDIISILRKMRLNVERFEMQIDGDERTEHPKSYEHVEIRYRLWGDIAPDKAERAIRLSRDRYCVVAHVVSGRASLHYTYQINDGPVAEVSPEPVD